MGKIVGGNGGAFGGGFRNAAAGVAGGVGIANSGAITTLTNGGAIAAAARSGFSGKAAGGSGVANAGTIKTLTNSGAINGGGAFALNGAAAGGAGVFNSGTIATLTNMSGATISGGAGSTATNRSGRRRRRAQHWQDHDADQPWRDQAAARAVELQRDCGRRRRGVQRPARS